MKKILLTRGKFALVDDGDFERLSKYKWCAQESGSTGVFYAERSFQVSGLYDDNPKHLGQRRRIFVSMARQIMGLCSDDSRVPDHINHNTLDNRRNNLRICTTQQNTWNSRKRKGCKTSQYKGISKILSGKWVVLIKNKYVGTFRSEIEAAKAYDEKAKELYGEYACLNFPPTSLAGVALFIRNLT